MTREVDPRDNRNEARGARHIVVAGDICVDWLAVSVAPHDSDLDQAAPESWRLSVGTRMVALPGGALLLAGLIDAATRSDMRLVTHELPGQLESIPAKTLIHSTVELDAFPLCSTKTDGDDLVYRVKHFGGFDGPERGTIRQPRIPDDTPEAEIVVLDDAGNGFRDRPRSWPVSLRTHNSRPIVVLKMSRPLCSGKLWRLLSARHADRLVVVVDVDDLRAEGLKISRQLSWERTTTDLVWQIASSPKHIALASCSNLIVRLGLDGAVHYSGRDGKPKARLYYDSTVVEGGFYDDCPGEMLGFGDSFAAGLTGQIARRGLDGVGQGVRDGMCASRKLFRRGFGSDPARLNYPGRSLFRRGDDDAPIAEVDVPSDPRSNPTDPDPEFWRILGDARTSTVEDMAWRIVRFGEAPKDVPIARFGRLLTVDRTEIESLRSIRNVLLEYVETEKWSRPLSLAVFGPPGAGKSFGVTQVATSIADHVAPIQFNVAQWVSRTDLCAALHAVRDVALSGSVPLVFFDEFDAPFERELGWLKYFLAPMQDGEFRDGGATHPIGKSIFVFAGGTAWTYREFARELGKETRVEYREFRDAKGPDFASRLRGYVNVLGPNPADKNDHLFVIRRAMLLRSQLVGKSKLRVESDGEVQIDDGVLRAFLNVPRYKHGARSMEAIIDMSMLHGRSSFEQAALPSKEQLEPHVDDAETFLRLVVRDALLAGQRETIARAIHEKFRRDQKGARQAGDPAVQPWEELSPDLRHSNYEQAEHIPAKLRAVRCGFFPVDRRARRIRFTDAEVELLAQMEHERWVVERRNAGWTRGARRDHARKRSPYLMPWEQLAEAVKEWDRDEIRGLPDYMADAGFEIYRLD